MVDVLRPPIWARIGPVPDRAGVPTRGQEYVRVNLLVTTLTNQDKFFGLAGNPNWDWPVPKGYQERPQRRAWERQINLSLLSKDQFFGLGGSPNFDWPNPRGSLRAISNRGFVDCRQLNLYTPAPEISHGYIL